MAGPLFRLDNFCDPEVVREKLYESGRYTDLIDFLHGKKMHHEALELLEKFGKDEEGEDVTPALRGPQRTIAYLQQLPPDLIDLILEYAEWPIRADPEKGMEIFLADTENAETLPRDRVLDFLHQIDPKLSVRYLEHIINELGDHTPDFHQRLVDEYLDRLLRAKDEDVFDSEEEHKEWREKFEVFLRSSHQYNKARIFRALPQDGKWFVPRLREQILTQERSTGLLRATCNCSQQDGSTQASSPNLRLPDRRLRQSGRVCALNSLLQINCRADLNQIL